MLQPLKQQGKLILVDDGRCDSPGHSAKYCLYTFMEPNTGNIVDILVVPITEVSNQCNGKRRVQEVSIFFLSVLAHKSFFRCRSSHQRSYMKKVF